MKKSELTNLIKELLLTEEEDATKKLEDELDDLKQKEREQNRKFRDRIEAKKDKIKISKIKNK